MTDAGTVEVAKKFDSYPEHIKNRLRFLRRLILHTASETNGVAEVTETLKWGEPSYVTKTGSTIRIGWKKSSPEQYAMYFHCRTRLVDTFKALYKGQFVFDGNRAIVFTEDEEIPVNELKQCVSLALTYHLVKHLPMLGAPKAGARPAP